MPQLPPFAEAWPAMAQAALVGLLIGAQRETIQGDRRPGLRDFFVVSVCAGICGLVQQPALTAAVLVSVVVLATVYYLRATERAGITTEFTLLATFCLAYLMTVPASTLAPLAISLTVVLALALEAKRQLHRFVRQTITPLEFADTLRFLALIFVIYPLLPDGSFGPYQFFAPRRVWLFVILVSSISYVGYFLQKFLGPDRGLQLTAVLGGMTSTTAATASLARGCTEQPAQMDHYWRAAVLANVVQFPRVWAILQVINSRLAQLLLPVLVAMTLAGLLLYLGLARWRPAAGAEAAIPVRNPFRLAPALWFGALFTAVLLFSKWAAIEVGGQAPVYAAALAGSIDVDAVAMSLGELAAQGGFDLGMARIGVVAALFTNALVKVGIAWAGGGRRFAGRVAVGLGVMLAAGLAVLVATRG